jgi:hypothetical protein
MRGAQLIVDLRCELPRIREACAEKRANWTARVVEMTSQGHGMLPFHTVQVSLLGLNTSSHAAATMRNPATAALALRQMKIRSPGTREVWGIFRLPSPIVLEILPCQRSTCCTERIAVNRTGGWEVLAQDGASSIHR